MHSTKERLERGTPQTDDEVSEEVIRDNLMRWLRNAVAVLREEVPTEAWPRVAARLKAAGVKVPPTTRREIP
jgi:hypothetical protein